MDTPHNDILAYLKSHSVELPDEGLQKPCYRQIVQLHEEGRRMHEAYATFGTLCVNRAFQSLLDTLTPEYQAYLAEAEAMIPDTQADGAPAVVRRRAGSVEPLAAHSVPQSTNKKQAIQAALQQVSGCEEHWAAPSGAGGKNRRTASPNPPARH